MKIAQNKPAGEAEIKTRSTHPLAAPHWNSGQPPRPANGNLASHKICPQPCHSGKSFAKDYQPAATKMWWLP